MLFRCSRTWTLVWGEIAIPLRVLESGPGKVLPLSLVVLERNWEQVLPVPIFVESAFSSREETAHLHI